jgi:hypothetical protein
MTLIRKLALALCLASLFTGYSNSQQIDVTGNLTNFTNQATGTTSTWQNAGTIGNPLTCWAQGDPGYCGPLPRVAAWGTGSNIINFSYGLTDLYQVVNIKNALPNSGTGLQVNGFNFSFSAKNGNGWDNGQPDQLSAYVNIYNNTNSTVLESYNYNLNGKYNWTQFSYSQTFKSPYGVPSLGNAQYGFVGQDNNYWVGPYGPEITGVSFSLKYSVDPCATNPLYSTTCKGYMDALAKLSPTASTSTDTLSLPPPPEDGVPPPGSPPPPSNSQQSGPLPPPGSLPPPSGATQTAANNPAGSPPANQPPPPGGAQQSRAGEVKTVGDNKSGSSSGPSLASVMSMISGNQARIGNEARAVVQAAESQAAAAATSAQQQAESVAGSLTAQSIAGSMTQLAASTSAAVVVSTQSQMSAVNVAGGPQTSVVSIGGLRAATTSAFADTASALPQGMTPGQVDLYSFQLPQGRSANSVEPDVPPAEGIRLGSRSVLSDVIEQRPMLQTTVSQEQKTDAVNKNAQSNEVAGRVDIAAMATQPVGYQTYSFTLTDVPFYAPREIYRNQRTVDNARALRQLTNDSRHREMVEQQYKRN